MSELSIIFIWLTTLTIVVGGLAILVMLAFTTDLDDRLGGKDK